MFLFYRQGNGTRSDSSTYPKPHNSRWKPVSLYSQAKRPSMLALTKFGKLTGSREQVPCKDKKAKGPFSKSPPFWVLALIQQDDCCSSCSSICAIVHQIERGTYSGPQNETHVHHIISQFLGEPVFISVVAQVWELKGTLKVIRIAQWLSNYLVCLFVHFF